MSIWYLSPSIMTIICSDFPDFRTQGRKFQNIEILTVRLLITVRLLHIGVIDLEGKCLPFFNPNNGWHPKRSLSNELYLVYHVGEWQLIKKYTDPGKRTATNLVSNILGTPLLPFNDGSTPAIILGTICDPVGDFQ